MFPHLHETPINKMIQKKFVLNVILLVLSEIQFGHQGGGQAKNSVLGGFSDLFGIFTNISKLFFPKLYLDLVSGQVKVIQ